MSLLSVSHTNSRAAASTVATYRDAHYCIEPVVASPVVLRIGERSSGLASLYSQMNVGSCGFVTACNPLGLVLRDAANVVATTALCLDVQTMGLALLPGVGRDGDPVSGWPGEESIAVFGISRDATCELGQRYQQHAIVWADADAVPELVFLR